MKLYVSYDKNNIITGYSTNEFSSDTDTLVQIEINEDELEKLKEYPPMFLRFDNTNKKAIYDEKLKDEFKLLRMEEAAYKEEQKAKELKESMYRNIEYQSLLKENEDLKQRLASIENILSEFLKQ